MVFFSRMRLCDCDVGAIVPNFYFRDRSILQDSLSLSLSLSLSHVASYLGDASRPPSGRWLSVRVPERPVRTHNNNSNSNNNNLNKEKSDKTR